VNWQAFLEDEASTAVEDMAPDDTIYGIELLNANEPVAARRNGQPFAHQRSYRAAG